MKQITEMTTSLDLAEFKFDLLDFLENPKIKPIFKDTCSIQKSLTPSAFVYGLGSAYQPKDKEKANNFLLIKIDEEWSGSNIYSNSSASGEVIYYENNILLVKVISGNFNENDQVSNSNSGPFNKKIIFITKNRVAIGNIFKNFYKVVDDISEINEINFFIKSNVSNPLNFKIRSVFTKETLRDMSVVLKDSKKVIKNIIENEVLEELDYNILNYMKDIARKKSTLDLESILNTGVTLVDSIQHILTSITSAATEIFKRTRRISGAFAIVSPNIAALISSSLQSTISTDEMISGKMIGQIGNINVFVADFSKKDYILVGYKGKSLGDAGLIFCPYNSYSEFILNPETNEENLFHFLRVSIVRNPTDTGTGLNDSDFFSYREVNLGIIPGLND